MGESRVFCGFYDEESRLVVNGIREMNKKLELE